jgi:hypothetical protein
MVDGLIRVEVQVQVETEVSKSRWSRWWMEVKVKVDECGGCQRRAKSMSRVG